MSSLNENIELFYKESGSDKVYNVFLEETVGGTFNVRSTSGRRGSSLVNRPKCTGQVYDIAKKVYDKLIQEKTSKGYKADSTTIIRSILSGRGSATALPKTETEKKDTEVRPQLLNDVKDGDFEKYINDDKWCAQEKFDGRRRLAMNMGGRVTCTNRKGIETYPTPELSIDMVEFEKNVILDGEDLGSSLMVFDLLNHPGDYRKRYEELESLVLPCTFIKCVPTAWTKDEKARMYNELMSRDAEGIVFKRIDSEYKPGRPASGGDQLKYKFYDTASCVVTSKNATKRSIGLGCYNISKSLIGVGNCTVYPNQAIPDIGSIVEVRYLYYFEGGSLFQPVLLHEREDVLKVECTISQLKIKKEEISI